MRNKLTLDVFSQKHKKNDQDGKVHEHKDKIKKMQEVINKLMTNKLELRK